MHIDTRSPIVVIDGMRCPTATSPPVMHASVGGGDLNCVLWCSPKRQTGGANHRYAIAPLDGRQNSPSSSCALISSETLLLLRVCAANWAPQRHS